MLTIIGQDIISGNMGYIGTEPGRLYRMGPQSKVAEVSGEPPVVLPDCKKKPLKGLTIYGKSTQVTTTGAQLLDISKWTTYNTTYGLTMSIQDDIVRLKGIFQKDEVGKRTNAMFRFIKTSPGTVFPENVKFTAEIVNNTGTDGIYFTLTGLKENEPCIVISFFATCGDEVDIQLRPMLYVGDPVPKYEMYTGGQPSPSPEYPQEIESVGQDGAINIEVLGKNLIPFPYPELGGAGTQTEKEGVKYTVQGDGGIRCTGTPSSQFGVIITRIAYSATALSSSNPSNGKIVLSGGELYFDPKNNALFIYYNPSQVDKPLDTVFYPQIELGTVATPYEPYHEPQFASIATPNGLPGIPVASGDNYTDADGQKWTCDEIDLARGVYVQRVAFTTVDGNAIKFKARGEFWNLPDGSAPGCYDVNAAINNFFSKNMFGANGKYGFVYTLSTNMKKYFKTPDELNEFCKSKYDAGTPLTLYYALVTPIETPLTSDQLAAYKALRTYKGTTIIDNDAGAYMTIKYNT